MSRFFPLRFSTVLLLLLLGLSLGWVVQRVAQGSLATRAIEAEESSLELQLKGDRLVAEQRYSEALTAYKQAARLAPESAAVHLRIGSLYQLKNRYSDAEQELRFARELSPGDPEITYRLGQIYLALAYYPEAEVALRDTLTLVTGTDQIIKAQLVLGEVYLGQGKADAASSLFDQILAADNTVLLAKHYRALLAVPDNVVLARNLLSEVAQGGDAALVTKAVAASSRLETWVTVVEGDRPLQAGVILVEQNLPALAVTQLAPFAASQPNHQGARDYLGYAYLQQGDIAQAETELETSSRLEGGPSALTRFYLGELYSYQTRWPEAVESYERAIDQGITTAAVFSKLGRSLQATGQFTQAVKAYERSLEIDPSDLPVLVSMINILLLQLKDYDHAITTARQAMITFPDRARPKSLLGWALLEKGDTEAAEIVLSEAIAMDPAEPSAYLNLGTLYEQQGKTGEAIAAYQKALDYDFKSDIARLADEALRRLLS